MSWSFKSCISSTPTVQRWAMERALFIVGQQVGVVEGCISIEVSLDSLSFSSVFSYLLFLDLSFSDLLSLSSFSSLRPASSSLSFSPSSSDWDNERGSDTLGFFILGLAWGGMISSITALSPQGNISLGLTTPPIGYFSPEPLNSSVS